MLGFWLGVRRAVDVVHGYFDKKASVAGGGFERDDFGVDGARGDLEAGDGDGVCRTARACAAGVDVEDAVAVVGFGLVAVPEYDGGKPGGVGVEGKVFEVVEEVDEDTADLDDFGMGEWVGPSSLVDVAADCGDGRDGLKFGQDQRRADVACVKDSGNSAKCIDDLRPNDRVGIGDEADVYGVCNHLDVAIPD